MSEVIDELRRRRRKKSFEKWIFRAVAAEAFFIAINPTIATVAMLCGVALVFLRFYSLRETEYVTLPCDVPAVLFVLLSALSIFASPDMSFSFYNWYNLVGVYALTYILVGQGVANEVQVKKIVAALAAGAILSILYGFFQAVFGVSGVTEEMRWVDNAAFPTVTERVYSTWENPNIFAGYLDIIVLLALGFWNYAKGNPAKKTLLTGIMLAAIVCLTFTYSRGAIISLAVVFGIYGVMKDRRLLVGMILVGIVLLSFDTALYDRLAGLSFADSSSALRLALWDSTLTMIADHPFFGIGWGAYFMVYPEYDFFVNNPAVIIYHAHNMYLNYAAEVGLVGAAAFFWFFFGTMKLAFNKCEIADVPPTNLVADLSDNFFSAVGKLKSSVNKTVGDKLTMVEDVPSVLRQLAEEKKVSDNEIAAPVGEKNLTTTGESKKEPATTFATKHFNDKTEAATGAEIETATTFAAIKIADETDTEKAAEKDDDAPYEMTLSEAVEAAKAITKAFDEERRREEALKKSGATMSEPMTDVDENNVESRDDTERVSDSTEDDTDDETAKLAADKDETVKEAEKHRSNVLDFYARETADEDDRIEPIPTKIDLRDALVWSDDEIRKGLTAGIGFAFVSVALNGLTAHLLFNIPSSMLLWFLAALVAVINLSDMNEEENEEEFV